MKSYVEICYILENEISHHVNNHVTSFKVSQFHSKFHSFIQSVTVYGKCNSFIQSVTFSVTVKCDNFFFQRVTCYSFLQFGETVPLQISWGCWN